MQSCGGSIGGAALRWCLTRSRHLASAYPWLLLPMLSSSLARLVSSCLFLFLLTLLFTNRFPPSSPRPALYIPASRPWRPHILLHPSLPGHCLAPLHPASPPVSHVMPWSLSLRAPPKLKLSACDVHWCVRWGLQHVGMYVHAGCMHCTVRV